MAGAKDNELALEDNHYLDSNGVVAAFEDTALLLKVEHGFRLAEVEFNHPERLGQVALRYSEKPSGSHDGSTYAFNIDRITGRVTRAGGIISGVEVGSRTKSQAFSDPQSPELREFLLQLAITPPVASATPIRRHFSESDSKRDQSMMIERMPRS